MLPSTILNRSRTKSKPDGVSPMEFLTKKVLKLNDIVAFGSACTIHVDKMNNSLGERGMAAIIIGKSDETKNYKVYIPKDKVVVVTHMFKTSKLCRKSKNNISSLAWMKLIFRRSHLTMTNRVFKDNQVSSDVPRSMTRSEDPAGRDKSTAQDRSANDNLRSLQAKTPPNSRMLSTRS